MLLSDRIKCFSELGNRLNGLDQEELNELSLAAHNGNSWFTQSSVAQAIEGISMFMDIQTLESWIADYNLTEIDQKKIGVVAAGNIPLVGFHDLLAVLIAGHQLLLKPSSDDQVLMHYIRKQLMAIDPYFETAFQIVERLNESDAFIATGSDNSARYFQYYFKDKPNVIRANRSSLAVLTGKETEEELRGLGKDIFQYYGLGCRNVSKVLVPEGYSFQALLDALQVYEEVGDHHKYRNNYDYNKSIYLVNREDHLDNGFLLLRRSEDLVSPISVLYFDYYKDEKAIENFLENNQAKIQCVVGQDYIGFGEGQKPRVDDYADGVDTLAFLQQV